MNTLEIERNGKVGVLWLNRPERLNAINRAMLDELGEAFRSLAADASVRVVVLAGRGRSFSSGFDIEPQPSGQGFKAAPEAVADLIDLDSRMARFLEIWDFPKPVIAVAHGHCLAGATLLCTFADLTLVASDAKIGYTTMPLGGGFVEPAWVHLIGPKRTKQLALIPGATISGTTAADWGWANYAVESGELMNEALRVAESMARIPSDILMLRKRAINRMVELSGFKDGVKMAGQTDALTHQAAAVLFLRNAIKENGLKEALRMFQAGELDK